MHFGKALAAVGVGTIIYGILIASVSPALKSIIIGVIIIFSAIAVGEN